MSQQSPETPPDLDAILESIRTRVTGEVAATVAPAVKPVAKAPEKLLSAPVIDPAGTSVEALFTAILEPLLRQWIDANLPEIAERAAQAEIRRLSGMP